MTQGFPSAQTRLLYFIVTCGYGARKGLLPLAGSVAALSRGIGILLANHHISEHTVTEATKSGWRVKEVYYRPTRLGIDYLASQADKMPAETRWVRDLPARIRQCRFVKGSLLFGQERILRYLAVSSAAMFTAVADCNVRVVVPVEVSSSQQAQVADIGGGGQADCEATGGEAAKQGSSEVKNRTTLHLAIRDLLREDNSLEQNSNGTIMNNDSEVLFIDAYQIKDSLRKENVSQSLLRVGRYTGIVESPLKTVLLYAGRHRGMGWSKSSVDTDVRAFQAYVNLVSRYHSNRNGDWHGALLVSNAKMFEDLYKDKEGKRWKDEKFANGFKKMLIFPMTEEGAFLFGKYMTVDAKAFQAELVDAAVASGVYQNNMGSLSNVFPLLNSAGVRMAVGLFIDAIQIQELVRVYERDKKQMGIVCYAWQVEYYRRVVPEDTLFMTVA